MPVAISPKKKDNMIITDPLQYIPFKHLDREQVAELLGRSKSGVDYYVARGCKICQGYVIHLKRQPTGKFLTSDVISFIAEKNRKNKS